MEAVLFRTASGLLPVQNSIGCVFSGGRSNCTSPRNSLHSEPKNRGIRRVSSESDVIKSVIESSTMSKVGSRFFPSRILEEDYAAEDDIAGSVQASIGSLTLTKDMMRFVGSWSESGVPFEEQRFPGDDIGKNWNTGGNGHAGGDGHDEFTGGNADRRNLGAYYEEMLKSNPCDSLLLRNYGKYLHEVERNLEKAEEYYGRAILASPGDGELLSLYGKLIWETRRDESRAKCYFGQAVHASPDDCTVLGSYAHFMWEAEEEDGEETERHCIGAVAGTTMVGA